ncbi:MAG: outer membrane beta-barrel protein [Chitinophagaceae bacterium]
MKKIYVYVLAMCLSAGVMAQTDQGNWLVGGNFNLNTANNSTSIGLNPTAGYFIINNLAIGGTIALQYEKFGENKSTTFGIGPLARYYFGKTNIKPFLNGELTFISEKFKFPLGTNTENGLNYFLGLGIAAFLNENVALEGIAGYNHTKINDAGDGDGGFAFRVGFQVYLHPKRVVDQIQGN